MRVRRLTRTLPMTTEERTMLDMSWLIHPVAALRRDTAASPVRDSHARTLDMATRLARTTGLRYRLTIHRGGHGWTIGPVDAPRPAVSEAQR